MSNGNGPYKPGDIFRGGHRVDPVTMQPTGEPMEFRVVGEMPEPPLTARRREQQRLDYVEKVDKLAFLTRETCKAVDRVMFASQHDGARITGALERLDTLERHIKRNEPSALARIDDIERASAVRNASLLARLRWLMTGR